MHKPRWLFGTKGERMRHRVHMIELFRASLDRQAGWFVERQNVLIKE